MRTQGAIFDFDGTLVDSLGMWGSVFERLADRYGTKLVPLDEIESLSIHDTATFFHDELGMEPSPEELYVEICELVRCAYQHEVKVCDGVHDLLGNLRAAGVPMALATSTPTREAVCALKAHGLDTYFDIVVSTEDVGDTSKEFPDVYLEAVRRLGIDPGATWVFEDAPFGAATARRAGFFVVGILNEHDGRTEDSLAPHADIVVHSLREVSLALLEDYERPYDSKGHVPLEVLVVDGSPEESSASLVAELAESADYVIAVDAGAGVLRRAGVSPDVFCGDADSVLPVDLEWAHAVAATDIRFPSEKYATDLSLALDCARHEAARQGRSVALSLTCASGGRADHVLAVVGLVAMSGFASARIVEDGFEMRVLSADGDNVWNLGVEAQGRTFSAIALSEGSRVDEHGFRWDLDDAELPFLGDKGISNVVVSPAAEIRCREGVVAAFLIWSKTT